MKQKFRHSAKNVFRDLGFDPEASESLRIKSELMIEITKIIESRGWTQAQAAEVMEVTQPRISNLVRGRIDLFRIDTLVAMLDSAGVTVQLELVER